MTKEFKDWLDEFVEQGANPKDVTNWPEEAGGTIELQDKTVSPTTVKQEVLADEGYDGLSKVTVNGVTNDIDENIVSGNIKKDVAILGVTGTYEFETQEKTVSPSTNTQEITPDENYDGLSKVTVNAVTKDIDSNIIADNIKRGTDILGVTGTYDGIAGATYNMTKSSAYFPESLASMGVAQICSNVYFFGGNGSNGAIDTIYKFNAKTETIDMLSVTLPQGLHTMGVAQIGSNVYLFGGHSDDNDVNTIYKFNVETETISTLSVTLPQALGSMGVAQIGSNVYLFGGHSDYNDVNTIYKFDTDTETISTLSVTLPQTLSNMGVAQMGSNVYLFGGISTKSVNTIYKFDTDTETISTLYTILPTVLCGMGVAQIGSNVYLFGGFSTKSVNTIYKFDTDTETISKLSVTLLQAQACWKMGVAQMGSNVYLFGGLKTSISKLYTIYKFKIDF